MLSEEEEITVKTILKQITKDGDNHLGFLFKPETIKWLSEKLLEINNECSQTALELYKLNQDYISLAERYE